MNPQHKIQKDYRQKVKDCAEAGKTLAIQSANAGLHEALYLYANHTTEGADGSLMLVRDSEQPPVGFTLVTGEGLRGHIPYEHFFHGYTNARDMNAFYLLKPVLRVSQNRREPSNIENSGRLAKSG